MGKITMQELSVELQNQVSADAQARVDAHETKKDNPHAVTKAQVGLGNADNTSDLDKPISTATQSALDSIDTSVVNVADDLVSHESNKSHVYYIGNVTGTGELYSGYTAISQAWMVDGLGICFVPVSDVTTTASIKIVTSLPVPILGQDGNPISSLKAGIPYTARLYSGNYYLQ